MLRVCVTEIIINEMTRKIRDDLLCLAGMSHEESSNKSRIGCSERPEEQFISRGFSIDFSSSFLF